MKPETEDDHETWLDDVAGKELQIQDGEIQVVDEPAEEKNKHRLRNRIAFFGLVGLIVLVIGWFVAGIFLAKVSVGDVTVAAHQSDETLQSTIEQQASAYRMTIAYPNGSKKSFSLADMGLSVDSSATVQNIRKHQHLMASRLKWWQPVSPGLTLVSNDTKRNAFLATQATVTVQPPTDATISIQNGVVKLTDSAPGKHNGLEDPIYTLETAARTLQNAPLQLQTLSTRPAITSTQLAPYQTKLKDILGQSVVFTIGTKKFQATTDDIADWIEISLKKDGKKIDVTVNSGKVLAYIDDIAEPYIKPATAQVEFTREDGTKAILSKGVVGTDVEDKSKIATAVAEDLLNNKAVAQNLEIAPAELESVSADSYDKWIEVDLTNKVMYAYEQSKTVKSFLVSAGAPATPTVTGQYKIYAKLVQQDMRGLNVDGSSYFQPNVSWINYFYKDYAIHGNYWRPLSWFGNINSSHGCVSLPDVQAQWVYSWAPVGTPVIIHL